MVHRIAIALREELRLDLAGRAVVILVPLAALALLTGNGLWLRGAVLGISVFIAAERTELAPLGSLLHGLVILICFCALLAALSVPLLFIMGCAALAMAAIYLTRWGPKFRSLGNWTFIPALYLACDIAEYPGPHGLATRGLAVLPYLAAGIIPPLLLSVYDAARARPAATRWARYYARLLRAPVQRNSQSRLAHAVTFACAVAAAAALVEGAGLGHGQWVIWSAASVVTGDWQSARQKLQQRATGAVIGVPLGACIGFLLPHTDFIYGLAVLGAIVTLVAFTHYIPGFATRCAFVAIALVAIGGGHAAAAASRVENVLTGGGIGVLAAFLGHLLSLRRAAPRGES